MFRMLRTFRRLNCCCTRADDALSERPASGPSDMRPRLQSVFRIQKERTVQQSGLGVQRRIQHNDAFRASIGEILSIAIQEAGADGYALYELEGKNGSPVLRYSQRLTSRKPGRLCYPRCFHGRQHGQGARSCVEPGWNQKLTSEPRGKRIHYRPVRYRRGPDCA